MEQLGSWGVEVEAVSSAAEAFQRMKAAAEHSSPFTMLLTDYQMPEDGAELVRRVASDPQL